MIPQEGEPNNPQNPVDMPVILILPSKKKTPLHLSDLWDYRELLYFMVWRDLKVRYKQTVLGVAWAILQPFLTMVVFSIFWGRLAGIPSDGVPYPIFVYVALLPWQLFVYGLNQSSNSLVSNEHLITKVYFPRLIIPISAVLTALIDLSFAFFVLIGMMLFFGIVPTIAILALPFLIAFAMVTSLSVGLWLSALNVKYRDVRHAIPFLTQIWLFASPIAYPSSLIPEPWRALYGLNPMAGVVEGFRWALLGTSNMTSLLIISIIIVGVLLVTGLVYFRQVESTFADVI